MKKFPFVFLKEKLTVHCLVPGLAAAISTVLLCTVPVSASAKAAGRSLKTDKTDGASEVYSSAVSTACAPDSAENQNPKEKIQILKSDGTPYTFSVLGDSISCYSGIIPKTFNPCYPYGDVTDCREMWWAKTADDLGLVLYADSSAAGSSVCPVPGNNDPGKKSFGDDERLSFLTAADGSVPDIIFVYGGMNDFLMGIAPDTFGRYYDALIQEIGSEQWYPDTRIICFTETQTYLIPQEDSSNAPCLYTNATGYTTADYSRQIRIAARENGVACIELGQCITEDNAPEMLIDGMHPTAAGMELIAAKTESELLKILAPEYNDSEYSQ